MSRTALSWLTCVPSLVGGCALTCEDLATEPATLEVGTGERSFEPVASGDTLSLVSGLQGGEHIWASLRSTGLAAGRADVHLWVSDGEVTVAEFGPLATPLQGTADPRAAEVLGRTMFFGFNPWDNPELYPDDFDPDAADDDAWSRAQDYLQDQFDVRPWALRGRVEDTCGRVAEAQTPVSVPTTSYF